jgi:sortase (surface protein transpeptidase)
MPGLSHRRRLLVTALAGFLGFSVTLAGISRAEADPRDPPAGPAPDDRETASSVSAPAPQLESVRSGIPPVSLAIPKLGVGARTVGVGQDEDGAMSSPSNPDEVAWYAPGPGMGVGGNVVFAGHVDWGGRLRVFGRLSALDMGDAVLVVDADGNRYEYVVESSRWVRAEGAPVEEIFGQTDDPVITLITCGGAYNPATREYLDRLIVRARGG